MNDTQIFAALIVAGVIIGVAIFLDIRRDLRKMDRQAHFEALKWGAINPDFTEKTRRECQDALHRMARD